MKTTKLTESAFQNQVIDLAHLYGWKVATFRKVRVQRPNGTVYYETPVGADGTGWPDLILVKGDRILACELKVGTNTATPEQREWLDRLHVAGVSACIWRPKDWPMIERELSG